jgi:single-stranded DNA-binding protein
LDVLYCGVCHSDTHTIRAEPAPNGTASMPGRNLSKFAKTLQKGQLITLEGTLRYREVEDEIEATTFKQRIAEVHATSMKRLSKIEAADDPSDGAGDE